MSKQYLHIWLFSFLLLALYLPYFFSSLSIVLFVVYALLTTRFKKPRRRFLRRYNLPLLFSTYFLIALISVLYSDDKAEGWGALGNMLGFLVLPWSIVSFKVADQQQMLRFGGRTFRIATLLISIYFLGAFLFLNTGVLIINYALPLPLEEALGIEMQSLRYISLGFMHPGYFSMYLGIALMMTLSRGVSSKKAWKKLLHLVIGLNFFLIMFLLQSRMTVVALVIVCLIFLVSLPRYRRIAVPVLLGIIAISWWMVEMAPEKIAGRYVEFDSLEYEKTDQDFNGITIRLAVWEDVWGVIRENPIFGVGLGDYRSEILAAFEDSNFHKALKSSLDPHNQYLSTWVAMGLPGLVILILILYFLIVPAYRKGDRLAFAVSVFIALCALSESIMIRHWGIVIISSLVFLRSYIPIRKKEEYGIEEGEK